MSEHHDGVTLADVAVLDIWGKYASAIERWAEIVGRPAPPPTDDEGRLNPAFVEWMQGFPEGWCDPVATRTGKLRCLGNAIVPLQAASAWGHLVGLEVTTRERERASADSADQRHERSGQARQRWARSQDGRDMALIPTPTAWLGRRPSAAIGDADRWANPARSRELSDFLAWLDA